MERAQVSIGRLVVFSFLSLLVVFFILHYAWAASITSRNKILAQKIVISPTLTSTPTSIPTIVPTVIPTATPIPPYSTSSGPTINPTDNTVWDRLADCESHRNWADDTGNGYYGGLQFSQGAWESVGGSGNPAQASRDEQIIRGRMLQAARGWSPWNTCSRMLGL